MPIAAKNPKKKVACDWIQLAVTEPQVSRANESPPPDEGDIKI